MQVEYKQYANKQIDKLLCKTGFLSNQTGWLSQNICQTGLAAIVLL